MNSLMGGNVWMQALGAMFRGEHPKTFLSNLAKNNPKLQGMNFDNLEQTAKNVCNDNGVDMNQKMKELQSQFPK